MTEINITKKEEKELFFKALLGSPFFNIFASVLATFIVGAVFFKFGGGVPIQVTQTSTEKVSTFDVTGEGKIVVKPDQAEITLGVVRESASITTASEQVDQQMQELSEELKKIGVEEKDIKTVDYSVYPNYSGNGRAADLYTVSSRVRVIIRDIEKASQVVDLVGTLGLEQSQALSFGLSDELYAKTLKDARSEAIEKAKSKAKELAQLAGMNLGKIVNVVEGNNGGYPQPMPLTTEMAVDAMKTTPAQIEPGLNEVVVTVVLSYETR